jgi:hypothetical protein
MKVTREMLEGDASTMLGGGIFASFPGAQLVSDTNTVRNKYKHFVRVMGEPTNGIEQRAIVLAIQQELRKENNYMSSFFILSVIQTLHPIDSLFFAPGTIARATGKTVADTAKGLFEGAGLFGIAAVAVLGLVYFGPVLVPLVRRLSKGKAKA